MPVVRNPQAVSVQVRVVRSQVSWWSAAASEAIPTANGTENPTYPTYRTGGWTAIRMWFWRRGFAPRPVPGRSTADQGAQPDRAHPAVSAAAMQTAKGLATVAIRPNQKAAIIPSTDRVPPASGWSRRYRARKTAPVKAASTSPHRTIEPSSAAHPAAMVKISGVPARWLLAM